MIVVAPAGGWAARRSRSTPPVSATETATAPIRAGVTPCSYALGSPSSPNAPSAATAATIATKCPDHRVSRSCDLSQRRLEDKQRRCSEAREEERLSQQPRPEAAESESDQRPDRGVDRIATVAPARVEPPLQPVGTGNAGERSLPAQRPDRSVRVLSDSVEPLVVVRSRHADDYQRRGRESGRSWIRTRDLRLIRAAL